MGKETKHFSTWFLQYFIYDLELGDGEGLIIIIDIEKVKLYAFNIVSLKNKFHFIVTISIMVVCFVVLYKLLFFYLGRVFFFYFYKDLKFRVFFS